MSWCLIECDPAVFWEILHTLQCHSLDFVELWSSDEDVIRQTLLSQTDSDDMRGLIFLYRYGTIVQKEIVSDAPKERQPIFMKQMIENSCATQALLSVALNQPDSIALGDVLESFKALILNLDPETRGWALGNHTAIIKAHNVFGATSQLATSEVHTQPKELPFHYVAYVPCEGQTYLLDGLRSGPMTIGKIEPNRPWYSSALKHVQDSIASSTTAEITFSLIGVVKSDFPRLNQTIAESRRALREELLTGHPDCTRINRIVADLEKAKATLAEWQENKRTVLADNELRKMSMIPLYIEVLRTLARRGLLPIFQSN